MTIEEIKAALATALPMRPPKWEKDDPPRGPEKVELLENYLLDSAYARAELEEALHWLDSLVAHFVGQVEQITGYEALLPSKPSSRITQQDVNAAKRKVSPTIFDAGAEARQLRTSVERQIKRFEFEEQWVLSRAYTMISGRS